MALSLFQEKFDSFLKSCIEQKDIMIIGAFYITDI